MRPVPYYDVMVKMDGRPRQLAYLVCRIHSIRRGRYARKAGMDSGDGVTGSGRSPVREAVG